MRLWPAAVQTIITTTVSAQCTATAEITDKHDASTRCDARKHVSHEAL
jgi:hypothetical protein